MKLQSYRGAKLYTYLVDSHEVNKNMMLGEQMLLAGAIYPLLGHTRVVIGLLQIARCRRMSRERAL